MADWTVSCRERAAKNQPAVNDHRAKARGFIPVLSSEDSMLFRNYYILLFLVWAIAVKSEGHIAIVAQDAKPGREFIVSQPRIESHRIVAKGQRLPMLISTAVNVVDTKELESALSTTLALGRTTAVMVDNHRLEIRPVGFLSGFVLLRFSSMTRIDHCPLATFAIAPQTSSAMFIFVEKFSGCGKHAAAFSTRTHSIYNRRFWHTVKVYSMPRAVSSNSHVNTQERLDFDGGVFGKVDAAQQVELVIAEDQIALTFEPVESGLLILSEDDRDYLPASQGEQADPIHSLEAHQSFVIGHRTVRLEHRASLVPLVALHGLTDGADSHLARQTECIPKLAIAEFVDVGLAETLGLESNGSGMACGSVERSHRRQQLLPLFGVGQNLDLQRQLHTNIIGYILS
jgi:hypothetical protein